MGYTKLPEPWRSCFLYLYLYKYEHDIELYDFLVQHKFPETRARYINPSLKKLSEYIISGSGLHDIIKIERKDPNDVIKKLLQKEECKLKWYTINKIVKNQPYELEELNELILNSIKCENLNAYFDNNLKFHVEIKQKEKVENSNKKKGKSLGKDLSKYFEK